MGFRWWKKSKPNKSWVKRSHAQFSWVKRKHKPLIRPQHQQSYDKMAPQAPGQRLRVIRLRRKLNESLGFAVRGGFEHGIGVFVSHVQPGSQAAQRGLKMGDEIVRVNGFTIAEAIHEEVLNLIKGRDEIELKVTNIGMVPIKQNPTDPVTWQYVDRTGPSKQQPSGAEGQPSDLETRKIFINLRGAPGLGCSIISGPKQYPGIYVESVRPGSLGEDYGLEVGDQLVEVNGKSFLDIKHKEAIVELKGSKELNIVIRKGAGLALLSMKNKSPKGSPVAVRKGPDNGSPDRDRKNSVEVVCEMLDNDLSERQRMDDRQQRLEQEREREKQLEEDRRRIQLEEERRRIERGEEERKRIEREEEERKRLEREEEERKALEEKLRKQKEEEKKQKEIERRQAELRQLELEKQKEKERLAKELEKKRQQEEEKAKQEELRKEQARRKQEEEKKRESERKKLEEKEEEKRKAAALAQKRENAVLAGRLGPTRSMKPTLLGAGTGSATLLGTGKGSETSSSSDKVIKEVTIRKDEDLPLDMGIEGGIGSPLGDKIVVSDVYPGGAVDQNGEIRKGDQVLEIDGKSLSGMQLSQAEQLLWEAEQNCPVGGSLKFLIAESEFRASQDEVTYF